MEKALKIYNKTDLMIELGIPSQPHLICQWTRRGIIKPKKGKNGKLVYTDKHLERLKEYKSLRDSLKGWQGIRKNRK